MRGKNITILIISYIYFITDIGSFYNPILLFIAFQYLNIDIKKDTIFN